MEKIRGIRERKQVNKVEIGVLTINSLCLGGTLT